MFVTIALLQGHLIQDACADDDDPRLGPSEITNFDFDGDEPVLPGYTVVSRRRKGLIIAGAITLGVSYAMSASVGTNPHAPIPEMFIPFAGPFLEIRHHDEREERGILAALGAAQIVGAIMLTTGLVAKKRTLVRNDLLDELAIAPMANGGTGLALLGRF